MNTESTLIVKNGSLESDTDTRLTVLVTKQSELSGSETDSTSDYNEDTELPTGDVYALNSRRLNATHLQCIAESLSLPKGGSMVTTRQLIEGKLIELNRDPSNVQVISQGKDQSVHKLFLVDDNGIICTCTYSRDHNEHMTSQPVDTIVASEEASNHHSALRDNSKLERLTNELDKQSQELGKVTEQLHTVQLMLDDECQKSFERAEEIKRLMLNLDKEKQKSKRFWRLKCD